MLTIPISIFRLKILTVFSIVCSFLINISLFYVKAKFLLIFPILAVLIPKDFYNIRMSVLSDAPLAMPTYTVMKQRLFSGI